jgi:hypothetical protein
MADKKIQEETDEDIDLMATRIWITAKMQA